MAALVVNYLNVFSSTADPSHRMTSWTPRLDQKPSQGSHVPALTTPGCHYLGMVLSPPLLCEPWEGRGVAVMVPSGSPVLPSTGLHTDQLLEEGVLNE